jgi:N-terminal acetyltransferase B complex non-catalytic subunit
MARTDVLFSFLNKFSSQKKIPVDTSPPTVESNSDLPAAEMTPVEIDNAKIHLILLQLISELLTQGKKGQPGSSPASANVDDLVARLETWLTETKFSLSSNPTTLISLTRNASASDFSSVPSWMYFHTAYSTLETLKAVILFTTFASKLRSTPSSSTATRVTKDGLTALNKLALSVVKEVKTQTRTLKSNFAASGLLGRLVDVATNGPDFQEAKEGDGTPDDEKLRLSRQIEELVEMSSLELFCGSLMESWEEALDGVLTVCGTVI